VWSHEVAHNLSVRTVAPVNVRSPDEPLIGREPSRPELQRRVDQRAATAGRLALDVSIVSYAAGARIGVAADRGVIAQPDALVDAVQAAFREPATEAELEATST
jgi:hypothetical protein